MSKISIEGNASGTGTLTIAAPNTDSNFTLSIPEATGTIITTAGGAAISGTTGSFSGDLSFNSGFGSAAVAYGCRAWVNFNGTGTVAIRASGNVTSITDNGTGDYTVNFTVAMPDVNYSVVGDVNQAQTAGLLNFALQGTQAVGSVQVASHLTSGFTRADSEIVCVAVFR